MDDEAGGDVNAGEARDFYESIAALDDRHIDTFLELTECLDKVNEGIGGYECPPEGDVLSTPAAESNKIDERSNLTEVRHGMTLVTAHASVMYYGDRLALSTETVKLAISETDYEMFCRVVKCFTDMVMGTHTNGDVQKLRDDHDYLLKRWDSNNGGAVAGTETLSADDPRRAACDEINRMIKGMLETPMYYTSSCMSLIACGKMLRHLFKETLNREAEDFDDLMRFVRERMRHNPVYPFDCECKTEDRCSDSYKTLLSLILELPPIIHNQTYMLQILAYLMYEKEGREEIFIVNMKNVVSPSLLDKVPTRLAMLIGSLDENEIKSRMKQLRRDTAGLIAPAAAAAGPLNGSKSYRLNNATQYSRTVLNSLVATVHNPKIARLINALPAVRCGVVEMSIERCKNRRICLNADNANDIFTPKHNNFGKNRCCGYLKLDPVSMLTSSISLLQLCVYLYTDTSQAPSRSQRHFFVRDILLAMAKCSVNMDDSGLEDIFGYLDLCDVFKGFAHNPIFTSTFYRLFDTYLKSMKSMANRIQSNRRKTNRTIEKLSSGT